MNGSGRFGVDVAGKSTWSRKLGDEVSEACSVATVLGVKPFERPFKPQRGKNGRGTMAWTDNVDQVYIMLADQVVEVGIDKDQTGTSPPMAWILSASTFSCSNWSVPKSLGLMSSKVRSRSSKILSFKNIIAAAI